MTFRWPLSILGTMSYLTSIFLWLNAHTLIWACTCIFVIFSSNDLSNGQVLISTSIHFVLSALKYPSIFKDQKRTCHYYYHSDESIFIAFISYHTNENHWDQS